MFQLPVPISDYTTDLKSALDNSMRILQAMLDICGEEAELRSALDVILLLQCLLQGTHPARSSLRVLPHLNHKSSSDKVLKRLEALGISSLPQLLEHESPVAVLSQGGLTDRQTREAFEVLQKLPKLRIHWKIYARKLEQGQGEEEDYKSVNEEEEVIYERIHPQRVITGDGEEVYIHHVEPGAELQLSVQLSYANRPSTIAYTPRHHKQKTAGWFLLLGDADEEVDELIALRRAHMPKRNRADVTFDFSAPDVPDTTFVLTLYVCSDTYFGLDQEVKISIHTGGTSEGQREFSC
ncbi:activating signal cointegrator 1 complex subunit [Cystoisospora suis]|uniref:Activating signal cointegrator 1 complex subunit n=1 Tax=Cystoisospora suis TaxID=483139 RepID=A0A2C6KEV6_9APIC|nr:activating signal cointegrator 1 complex subunit [Cystoisospora suis]